MAMSVVYSNFCGRVVSETRGGVESDYISDTLGTTIGLMDSAGAMTDRWEYWPYGEVVSRTGTNPTPLTFLGVIGYFQDVLAKLFYVRARHLRVDLARWLTVDSLWPMAAAYTYAYGQPTDDADPTGQGTCENIRDGCLAKCLGIAVVVGIIGAIVGCVVGCLGDLITGCIPGCLVIGVLSLLSTTATAVGICMAACYTAYLACLAYYTIRNLF